MDRKIGDHCPAELAWRNAGITLIDLGGCKHDRTQARLEILFGGPSQPRLA